MHLCILSIKGIVVCASRSLTGLLDTSSETTAEWVIQSWRLLRGIAGWLESGFLSRVEQIAQTIFGLCWRHSSLLLLHLRESSILIHRLHRLLWLLLLWESHTRLLVHHWSSLTSSSWLLLPHHWLHHFHHILHLRLHRLHLHVISSSLTIHAHSSHLLLHLRHLLHIRYLLWILLLLHAWHRLLLHTGHRLLTHCLRNTWFLRKWVLPSCISHIVIKWVVQILGHVATLHWLETRIV